jgi:primosomal protein N' (replication factor Y)
MKIIEVIPAINLPSGSQQIFTYFCSFEPAMYSFVLVPVRKKMVAALVVGLYDSDEKKIDLKATTYQLKGGVKPIKNSFPLSRELVKTIKFIADYYFCSLGIALKTAVPNYVFKRKSFPDATAKLDPEPTPKEEKSDRPKPLLVVGPDGQRQDLYKKEIKKALDGAGQVLLLVPEKFFIEEFAVMARTLVAKDKIALIHSDLKEKEFYLEWQKVRSGEARIIIGTRSAIFCDFNKLSLIIIDRENNSSYKSWDMHPKYDARTTALYIAKTYGADIIFGDNVPRLESYNASKTGAFESVFLGSSGAALPAVEVVDMKKENEAGVVSVLSREAAGIIGGMKKGQKTFVFMNRRGDSPIVFCRDCGYTEMCERCDGPLVFHKQRRTKRGLRDTLLCHRCGAEKDPPLVCKKCQSHRIKFFGSGTQKFEEEITKAFPGISVLRIDSDSVPPQTDQKGLTSEIASADVIVGTSLVFRYFSGKFDFSIVGLADPVFYFPDFRSGERFNALISEMAQTTSSRILIQTYQPDNYIFKFFASDNKDFYGSDFLDSELKIRRVLEYPPFSQLIKISYSELSSETAKKRADYDKENLIKKISIFEKDPSTGSGQGRPKGFMYQVLGPAPAFIPKVKNNYVWNIILKDKAKNYRLRKDLLSVLSKYASADIDPDSTL